LLTILLKKCSRFFDVNLQHIYIIYLHIDMILCNYISYLYILPSYYIVLFFSVIFANFLQMKGIFTVSLTLYNFMQLIYASYNLFYNVNSTYFAKFASVKVRQRSDHRTRAVQTMRTRIRLKKAHAFCVQN
jgi:hypothetical protein